MILRPTTEAELVDLVRTSEKIWVHNRSRFAQVGEGPAIDRAKLDQIFHYSPADQVIEVGAGMTLHDLNSILMRDGFELPYLGGPFDQSLTLGELLDTNIPHWGIESMGSWRDWVLGIAATTSQGQLIKSGSSVVKSVAGYDLHKLMIGTHSQLGIISRVILKFRPHVERAPLPNLHDAKEVCRPLASAFDEAFRAYVGAVVGSSRSERIIVAQETHAGALPPHTHVWRGGSGLVTQTSDRFWQRAKTLFDPNRKLSRS